MKVSYAAPSSGLLLSEVGLAQGEVTAAQAMARLQNEQGVFLRVEAISEEGAVTASFWTSVSDPVVNDMLSLEAIC